MKKKKLIITILAILMVIVIMIVIKSANKNSNKTIIDDSIEVKEVTKQERSENAIDSTIKQLVREGATVSKLSEKTLDEANGYSLSLNGETIEMYYLERAKLAKIIKETPNGETTITIGGSEKSAIVYDSIFILNCNSSENKEILEKTFDNGINIDRRKENE